jgi:hypothetical protein
LHTLSNIPGRLVDPEDPSSERQRRIDEVLVRGSDFGSPIGASSDEDETDMAELEPPAHGGDMLASSTVANGRSELNKAKIASPLDCSMGEVVPAAAFAAEYRGNASKVKLVVSVCFDTIGNNCSEAASANHGEACGKGQFADLVNSKCSKCARGGFYSTEVGSIGYYSHCGCTKCKEGTFSDRPGAFNPVDECEVCPTGTNTNVSAGYRACPCVEGSSRADRFGPCESCIGKPGIDCHADARKLKPGYFWQFPNTSVELEYINFTQNLLLEADYDPTFEDFRYGEYPPVYVCPRGADACLGTTDDAPSACSEDTRGVLCAVCADDYFEINGMCTKCPTNVAGSIVVSIILLLVIIVVLAVVICLNSRDVPHVGPKGNFDNVSLGVSKGSSYSTSTSDESNVENVSRSGVSKGSCTATCDGMTVFKIAIGFIQVKGMLVDVYTGVPWPASYRSFTRGMQFVASNPLSVVMPSCFSSALAMTAYSKFVFAAVTPLVAVPIIYAYYLYHSWESKTVTGTEKVDSESLASKTVAETEHFGSESQASRDVGISEQVGSKSLASRAVGGTERVDNASKRLQLKATCFSTAALVYYMLFPTITVSSVRLLATCHDICSSNDQNSCTPYLYADYSIQCDTDAHFTYRIIAGIAFSVYGLIMPAAIAVLLHQGQPERHDNDVPASLSTPLMAGLAFYSKQYKSGFYYWETIELYRKLFVTGIVVFIAEGTSAQISFGVLFAVLGLVLQFAYSPYVHEVENKLASAGQLTIVLALLVGGLMRASQAEESAQMESVNVDDIAAGAYLVTSGSVFYTMIGATIFLFLFQRCCSFKKRRDETGVAENVGKTSDFARCGKCKSELDDCVCTETAATPPLKPKRAWSHETKV